jgi:multidrug resistance efflux pump
MFLVIGLIVVAGVAYLFYRWKTGRKILYTELR